MSLLIWDGSSFENNLKIRFYLIKILAREIRVGIHISFRSFKGGVHWIWYIGQPYEEKAQGRSSCCSQLPNGRMWERTEPSHLRGVHNGGTGGSGGRLGQGELQFRKRKETKLLWGFSNRGRSPERLESPSLEMLKIRLDKAPKHTVLARLALNWRFDCMTSLWRSLRTYVILCCCDLILALHILNRILK